MLNKSLAETIRKAFNEGGGQWSQEPEEWCDALGLEVEDVRAFLDGAVAYFGRQEDAYRAMGAMDLSVRIDTISGKKDGSNVLNLALAAETSIESIGRLFSMRGTSLQARLYDPQLELPIEYYEKPVASDERLSEAVDSAE